MPHKLMSRSGGTAWISASNKRIRHAGPSSNPQLQRTFYTAPVPCHCKSRSHSTGPLIGSASTGWARLFPRRTRSGSWHFYWCLRIDACWWERRRGRQRQGRASAKHPRRSIAIWPHWHCQSSSALQQSGMQWMLEELSWIHRLGQSPGRLAELEGKGARYRRRPSRPPPKSPPHPLPTNAKVRKLIAKASCSSYSFDFDKRISLEWRDRWLWV